MWATSLQSAQSQQQLGSITTTSPVELVRLSKIHLTYVLITVPRATTRYLGASVSITFRCLAKVALGLSGDLALARAVWLAVRPFTTTAWPAGSPRRSAQSGLPTFVSDILNTIRKPRTPTKTRRQ